MRLSAANIRIVLATIFIDAAVRRVQSDINELKSIKISAQFSRFLSLCTHL